MAKAKKKSKVENVPTGSNCRITLWGVGCFLLAVVAGLANKWHVETMFENDKHFSHLGSIERDMAFRTEMGLYYSYYQSLVDAPTWWEGFNDLVNDKVTEYPKTINVLKRFNLYPELAVGTAKRIFDQVSTSLKWKTKECWQINRGEGYSPIMSCEGIGDDHYFYVFPVWWLSGLLMSGIFLYGSHVSESLLGGTVAVLMYFYNHGEATRVMWTPPLRESWAFPFLVLQLYFMTKLIDQKTADRSQHIPIVFTTLAFMLNWQFSQFALLTQTASILGCYWLRFIGSAKLKMVWEAQMIAFVMNYIFQFGNEMLITSFYASSLVTVILLIQLENVFDKIPYLLGIPIQLVCYFSGVIGIKYIIASILNVTDDSHIFDIFKAKFTDYKNFHTQLYTCAKEFDFLEYETYIKLSQTCLIPAVLIVWITLGLVVVYREYKLATTEKIADSADPLIDVVRSGVNRSKPLAGVLYTCIQSVAFTVLAIMIMRMKLFMTPQLCIVAGLLCSQKLFHFIPRDKLIAVVLILVAIGTMQGKNNIIDQRNKSGEYSNYPQEELLEFINKKMPKNAVFGGSMPTMATIKLVTKRPIVNHPHYEDTGLRDRTHKLYTMFSRRPPAMVHQTMLDMQLDYFILEMSWCSRSTKDGCALPRVYDLEDVEYRGGKPCCEIIAENPEPYFKEVFKNVHYRILKINKKLKK